jgi:hypothetical protein
LDDELDREDDDFSLLLVDELLSFLSDLSLELSLSLLSLLLPECSLVEEDELRCELPLDDLESDLLSFVPDDVLLPEELLRELPEDDRSDLEDDSSFLTGCVSLEDDRSLSLPLDPLDPLLLVELLLFLSDGAANSDFS